MTFTDTLNPIINQAKAEAIQQEIADYHQRLSLLAVLTKDASSFEEIALRFVQQGLVDTFNPSDSVYHLADFGDELASKIAEHLWLPERDESWTESFKNFVPSEAIKLFLEMEQKANGE